MAERPASDRVTIEGPAGSFDLFNRVTLTQEITSPYELRIDLGDEGSYPDLARFLAPGTEWKVYLNDRARLRGRVYLVDSDVSPAGATVAITIRTRFYDAAYASADKSVRIKGASVKQFMEAIYAPLGFAASDIVVSPGADRDIATGRAAEGTLPAVPLEPLKLDQAKITPPETISEAATRILQRVGLMHWETPDGKIYVGRPDDEQRPTYAFRVDGQRTNVLHMRRTRDYSDAPSEVRVFGATTNAEGTPVKVVGTAVVEQLAGFHRPVYLPMEQVRSQAQADAAARRERAARIRRLDAIEVGTDGWSYWDGTNAIPYAPNTTADVYADKLGGDLGRWYIQRVVLTVDAEQGQSAQLSLVAPGTWEIG